jgi:hypothetical protein
MSLFYCQAKLDEDEDHRSWDSLKVHAKDRAPAVRRAHRGFEERHLGRTVRVRIALAVSTSGFHYRDQEPINDEG